MAKCKEACDFISFWAFCLSFFISSMAIFWPYTESSQCTKQINKSCKCGSSRNDDEGDDNDVDHHHLQQRRDNLH